MIERGIEPITVNIERQSLPLEKETADLIIANQILEHTKEIYWINHEIFRVLKVGGYLYLGVPNILSFHNRILGIFGVHPTCSKSASLNNSRLFGHLMIVSSGGELYCVERRTDSRFHVDRDGGMSAMSFGRR